MTFITEGAELRGESGKTYLAVSPLGQPNVWTAVEKTSHANIVVLKSPGGDDASRSTWIQFQHEMVMHELFKDCPSIRKMVDRIPPLRGVGSPPILVLEIFKNTLWHARTKRPFSQGEIRTVAKAIVEGLAEVHAKGLVYADLKMQNVMLNGFDTSTAGDGSDLVVKLGDLGIVMEPSIGVAQPVAYRAPEVYFKRNITQKADIWSFGLIMSHLLEAQTHLGDSGLYDDLEVRDGSVEERELAIQIAIANDYDLHSEIYYRGSLLPARNPQHETGRHWQELRKRGLDEREIKFLKWVLRADPTERPTAQIILDSKWFDSQDADINLPEVTMDGASDLINTRGSIHVRAMGERTTTSPTTATLLRPTSLRTETAPSTATADGSLSGQVPAVPFTPTEPQDLQQADPPSRPDYIGRHSSSGGTYLSYR